MHNSKELSASSFMPPMQSQKRHSPKFPLRIFKKIRPPCLFGGLLALLLFESLCFQLVNIHRLPGRLCLFRDILWLAFL